MTARCTIQVIAAVFGRTVLSELCPVVAAQHAEFYMLDARKENPRLTLLASFASKGNESPDANVDTGAEIKHPAGEFAEYRVGPAVDPRRALLIIGVAAANDGIRRNP